jgi:hypothetical protein
VNILNDFSMAGIDRGQLLQASVLPVINPLGALADLPGTWVGTGFNQIWRPFHGSQDRFLQLNLTLETLEFDKIPGAIPNRGLLQTDINLFAVRYLQQIQDAHVKGSDGKPAGIHIEPGMWLTVPATSNPQDAPTIARLATIPHGTSILCQGTTVTTPGAPVFAPASITPFTIAPPHSPIAFPETNLGIPSAFRSPPADIAGVTQAMVNNPNVVLAAGIAGKNIVSTTTLKVSTSTTLVHPPSTGGGTSNIAFLEGAAGGPNARSVQVDATFWIEHIKLASGAMQLQLQYSQRVLLDFNGLSWPHVSVATLIKK